MISSGSRACRLVLPFCFFLGCSAAADQKGDPVEAPTIVRAKAAVLRTLSAPELAEFQKLSTKIVKDARGHFQSIVCGVVNTYGNGGFAGFQPFLFGGTTSELIIASNETPPDQRELVRQACSEIYGKQ